MHIFYFYLIAGIILVISEAVFNTFYLLIIGVVFILAALLAIPIHSWVIITSISVLLSIISCILIRVYKNRQKNSEPRIAEHIGHTATVAEINNNKIRVYYSGSYWDAKLKNKNINNIKVGDSLTITRYHNNEFELD